MYQRAAARLMERSWAAFNTAERALLLAGCGACVAVVTTLSGSLGLPTMPRLSGSLLIGSSPLSSILMTAVAVGICTLLGAVVAAFLRLEAGMLCVAAGIAALSVRGGSMRTVLQYAGGPGVYLTMLVEVALLFILLGIAWIALNALHKRIWSTHLAQLTILDATSGEDEDQLSLANIGYALGVQVAVMILCESLLLQVDAKKQAMASIGIAALLGTMAACHLAPLVAGFWYGLGPVVTGALGYAMAYASPSGWQLGESNGTLGALARAIPLDYAGIGIAGVIIGYWTARRWKEESESAGEE